MFELMIICAVSAYGMFTLQRPGFLLAKLPRLWRKLPKAFHEPLFSCGICVSSVWGSAFYLYLVWVDKNIPESFLWIYWLPVVLIGAVGVASLMDRAVKAFESHYGYKPPSEKTGENKWDYLLPYLELRKMLLNQFISDNISRGRNIIEICGNSEKWKSYIEYYSFDSNNPLNAESGNYLTRRIKEEKKEYCVVILGLCFEGDIRVLKEIIAGSSASIIEYSDDGISRQQVKLLTEGITTKMLIPEYEINSCAETPGQCGTVTKRKVIILQP